MSTQQSINIPCLDFSLFLNGTEEEKQSLCGGLLKGFKEFGFVKLMNHGISDESIQILFDWVWTPQ
jgi:isopenicillin N synthase-like dioxygenase